MCDFEGGKLKEKVFPITSGLDCDCVLIAQQSIDNNNIMYGLLIWIKRTIVRKLRLYWLQLYPKNLRALRTNMVGAGTFFCRHLYMQQRSFI